MDKEAGPRDVLAIAALSAVLGGFLVATLLVGSTSNADYWHEQPMAALGSSIFAGFFGAAVAMFSAFPLGAFIGSVIWRFVGKKLPHAVVSGALTAGVLFCYAVNGETFVYWETAAWTAGFAALGGAISGFSFWLAIYRAGRFTSDG